MRRLPSATLGLFLALALTATTSFAAAPKKIAFDRSQLISAAVALPTGGEIVLRGVPLSLEGKDRLRDLKLQRFEVFAPQTRLVVHTATGETLLPRPKNVYLRGSIAGEPRSRVVVSILESGEIRGLATQMGRFWLLGAEPGDFLRSREVDGAFELEEVDGGFRCELDGLGTEAFRSALAEAPAALFTNPLAQASAETLGAFDHTALIAIETDNEFLNLAPIGGNTTNALDYIGDLVAFGSTLYTDELQTSWAVGDVSLWQVADPWQQSGTSCGLIDFGRYWNDNNDSITRTIAHFLSGKSSNSGVAWVGVLCNPGFSIDAAQVASGCSPPLTGVDDWGGAYGYTSGIDANFNINSPSVVWDILAFTHEIGHNFNSPHTHCYQNVNGNPASVDNCNAGQCGGTGCYCGATSLPSGCPGSGQGCGTIMSYCHLLSPGSSNVSLTLGLGHPYGIQPERVPNRMRSHVVSVAGGNPACLAPINVTEVFADGFETGNINAWSASVP